MPNVVLVSSISANEPSVKSIVPCTRSPMFSSFCSSSSKFLMSPFLYFRNCGIFVRNTTPKISATIAATPRKRTFPINETFLYVFYSLCIEETRRRLSARCNFSSAYFISSCV